MDALSDLHAKLAEVLKDAVAETVDEEGRVQAPNAAILSVARQFLKDNAITADLEKNKDLSELDERLNALPSFDDEEDGPAHIN